MPQNPPFKYEWFLECVCAVFAYVQLHLQEDAMDRFAPTAGSKIHIVLETEFRELAGVKRDVRRKPPALPNQIAVGLVDDKRRGRRSAGAVDVVHPETGDPPVDKAIGDLTVQSVILQPRGRNNRDVARTWPCLVVSMQILRLPGYERKALGVVHRLPLHV